MKNPQKHVWVLQHHACEGLGTIADALQQGHVTPRFIQSFKSELIPMEIGAAAGLIVMGGPQSAYEQDKFRYLRAETRLIEDGLTQEKPVLGVCLGSQLLAATLGAKVYPGRQKEIGWNRVTLTDFAATDPLFAGVPNSFIGLHWHGDIFDLPRGATLLASSALTANQAFRHGSNAYGLLFHMEVTRPQINTMVDTFADELQAAGLSSSAIKLSANTHLQQLQKVGQEVFAKWVAAL